MDPLFARCFNIIEMVGKVKQLWLYNGALVDQLLWGNASSLLLKDTLKFKTRLEISGIDIDKENQQHAADTLLATKRVVKESKSKSERRGLA